MSEVSMPTEVGVSEGEMGMAGQVVVDLPGAPQQDQGLGDLLGFNEPGVQPTSGMYNPEVSALTQQVLAENQAAEADVQYQNDALVRELREQNDHYRTLLGRQGNEVGELRQQNAQLAEAVAELRGQMNGGQQQQARMRPEDAYEYLGLDPEDTMSSTVARASLNVLQAAELGTDRKLETLKREIISELQGLKGAVGGIGMAAKYGLKQDQIDAFYEMNPELRDLPTERVYPVIARTQGQAHQGVPPVERLRYSGAGGAPVIVRAGQHVESGSGGVGASQPTPGFDQEKAFERFRKLNGDDKLSVFTEMLSKGQLRM